MSLFSPSPVVLTTAIPGLPLHARGKVRDVYAVGNDALLLVATDRLSAFDVVMGQGIPEKGRVLTQTSVWWFAQTQNLAPNHLITADDDEIAARLTEAGANVTSSMRDVLRGRAMLCKRTRPLPIEAVVRGYLSGSGWKAYQTAPQNTDNTIDLWGVLLPPGLRESDKLPHPIFTPSTKAGAGHDEPMPQNEIANYIGKWAAPVQNAAVALYEFATQTALSRGIILADTKFEFGIDEADNLLLIDEALTPDSSRFWDAASYAPGRAQASWDKQFVRDFLETVPGWNKQSPAPDLPPDIIEKTSQKYRDALHLLTGHDLS